MVAGGTFSRGVEFGVKESAGWDDKRKSHPRKVSGGRRDVVFVLTQVLARGIGTSVGLGHMVQYVFVGPWPRVVPGTGGRTEEPLARTV